MARTSIFIKFSYAKTISYAICHIFASDLHFVREKRWDATLLTALVGNGVEGPGAAAAVRLAAVPGVVAEEQPVSRVGGDQLLPGGVDLLRRHPVAFEGPEAVLLQRAHGRIVVVGLVLDQPPAPVAGRHHGEGARFHPDLGQGDPAVAAQLGIYPPVEGILTV